MADPEEVFKMVKTVYKAVSPSPVTVKIRSGIHAWLVNAVEVALAAQEGGAAAVTVHPRTKSQGFKGVADWGVIGEVADSCSIPVIGSGDFAEPGDAKRMLDETGCAGVMIGRGALGRPWFFLQAHAFIEGYPVVPEPSPMEIGRIALRHLASEVEIKGERRGVVEMRKHLIWYTKGMPNARTLRDRISKVSTLEESRALVVEFFSLEEDLVGFQREEAFREAHRRGC